MPVKTAPKKLKPVQTRTTAHRALVLASADEYAIDHHETGAIQYDIYVPAAIWDVPAVKQFIERVNAIEEGWALIKELTGLWRGDGAHLYRVAFLETVYDADALRQRMQDEIGRLMADLAVTRFAQKSVTFTEIRVKVNVAMSLRRK